MLKSEYFLWGAGTYGARLIDVMKDDLCFRAVIDNDNEKQGSMFHGVPVISYEDAKEYLPSVKIVLSSAIPRNVQLFLKNEGYVQNIDFFAIFQFVPRYFWAKNKLSIQNINAACTTICNMRCDACLCYGHIAKRHRHLTIDEIKNDFDLLFNHIDYVVNIPFCCGESMLNAKAVADACNYIYENYENRYHTLTIVTNGSTIPNDEVMQSFAKSKTVISISEYPSLVMTKQKLIERCKAYNVSYLNNTTCNIGNWHGLGDPRTLSIDNPTQLVDGCLTVPAGLIDGWLYTCSAQMYAQVVAGIGSIQPGDAFDLRKPVTEDTREEVYRIISAQPEKGYVSHCTRCYGTLNPLMQS